MVTMRMKKLLALALALCVMISVLPVAARADGETIVWIEIDQSSVPSSMSGGKHYRLTENITANINVPQSNTAVLDLNGYTLSNDSSDNNQGFTVKCSGTLTIQDSSAEKTGKVTNTSNKYSINMIKGSLTLEGGTYTNTSSNALYIKGGNVNICGAVIDTAIGMAEGIDKENLTITAGKFKFLPSAYTLATGSTLATEPDSDGYYTVTAASSESSGSEEPDSGEEGSEEPEDGEQEPDKDGYVAQVGEVKYTLAQLQTAVNAAIAGNTTLTLLADIPDTCELKFEGALTVALSGHTWKADNLGSGTVTAEGAKSKFTVTASITATDRINSGDDDTEIDLIAGDELTVTISVSGGSYYGAYIEFTADSALTLSGDLPSGWTNADNTFKYWNVTGSEISAGDIGTFTFKVASLDTTEDKNAAVTVTKAQISASPDEAASTITKPEAVKVSAAAHIIYNRAVTIPTAQNSTYNGESHTSGITATDKYTVSDEGGTAAGSYTATLTLVGNGAYYWDDGETTAERSVTYSITALTIEVGTAPTLEANLTYNGSAQALIASDAVVTAPTSGATVVYYISDTTPESSATGTSAENTKANNAGTYTVWYRVSAANYATTEWTKVGDVKIAPAEISTDWFTAPVAANRTADSTGAALVSAAKDNESEDAPSLSFQYKLTESGDWSDEIPTATDAGTYTVYYKVSAANYADRTGNVAVTLSAAKYVVAATEYISGRTMVYLFTDEAVHFQYGGASMYDVTAMGYAYAGEDSVCASGGAGATAYAHVYALLLDGGTDYDSTKITAVSKDTSLAGTITASTAGACDVNNDKSVTIDDAVAVSGVVNAKIGSIKLIFRADVDRNGKVDLATDAIAIKDACLPTKQAAA
jgi:hypothetical protein